ncbi:MAG: hypothetical protein P8105_04665 [Dehalococcoidia bacterium]
MSQELGKIEKPDSADFKKGRKLFLVPLIYASKEAPEEYIEKYELYWQQVAEQILNLESKIGLVKRIYHESISMGGEEGLSIIEKLNVKSHQIARQKCENDAELQALEDRELAEEYIDWQRCLLIGLISEKAANKITEYYRDATRKRYEYISKRIDKTLKKDETAILFIQEGHMIQFPKDVEVFSVAPPALDEIHRWIRDNSERQQTGDSI